MPPRRRWRRQPGRFRTTTATTIKEVGRGVPAEQAEHDAREARGVHSAISLCRMARRGGWSTLPAGRSARHPNGRRCRSQRRLLFRRFLAACRTGGAETQRRASVAVARDCVDQQRRSHLTGFPPDAHPQWLCPWSLCVTDGVHRADQSRRNNQLHASPPKLANQRDSIEPRLDPTMGCRVRQVDLHQVSVPRTHARPRDDAPIVPAHRGRLPSDAGRLRRGLIPLRWLIDPYRFHDAWNLRRGSVVSRNLRNRCSVSVCPTSHSHTTSTSHPSPCSAAKCS